MRSQSHHPRSSLARSASSGLEAPERAIIRNVVAAQFAERGASEIPSGILANARVRLAFGLGPLPADETDVEEIPFDEPGDSDDDGPPVPNRRQLRRDRDRVAAWWKEHGTAERVPWAENHIARGLRLVGRTLGLGGLETEILQLVLVKQKSSGVALLERHSGISRREDLVEFVAAALVKRPADVRPRVASLAPLFSTGLVMVVPDGSHVNSWTLAADPRLVMLVLEGRLRRQKLLARFLIPEPRPVLRIDDFPHLRPELEALRRILHGALSRHEEGHNYLLYGPSGVGKTEIARIIATSVGAELFAAPGADDEGDPVNAAQRLAALRVGHRMLARTRAVMLFDEFEDLDPQPEFDCEQGTPAFGKLWMNQLLERNATPTIWVSNSLAAVDPAYLRRFTFAIHFPPLGREQRRKVWSRLVGGALSDAEIEELASAYDVSPGEIASAVRAARAAGDGSVDLDALRRILAGAVRVMGCRPAPALRAGKEYRPEAVNASVDLVRLGDALCRWEPGAGTGVSLCLYGYSGTGKSEWVHHLARRMGRALVVRGVSDLESPFVGQTERNLADAFEEAVQRDAILLLDECDWLLADRRRAIYSWEQARVAEALQQLEAFRGIVACTTNLFRDLDQAVLRRFVHKVQFFPLRPEQALAQWDAHLARFLPPPGPLERAVITSALQRMPGLTPGDFAVVARRVAQLGGRWTVEALLRELETEAVAKGQEGRPIGF